MANETNILKRVEDRLAAIENWRVTRWHGDDLYKKLPLIGQRNLVEPTVTSILRYFLKPGDVAFDIGSQAGHVVHAMSQLVGPKGMVVAFEASVRTARKLLINIADANLRNVEVVHAAVCQSSGTRQKLYLHSTQNNDSLYPGESENFSPNRFTFVETVTLDSYCQKWSIYPALIKLDIEGAELEALRGAEQTLREQKPIILIEDLEKNLECYNYLSSLKYSCYDLISLKRMSPEDRMRSSEANFLYIPSSHKIHTPFNLSMSLLQEFSRTSFSSTRQPGLYVSELIKLNPKTRYVVSWDIIADNLAADSALTIGVLDHNNELIARYQGSLRLLKAHYQQLPFEADLDSIARLFVLQDKKSSEILIKSAALSVFC